MKNRIFIDVDTQVDFCAKKGSLYIDRAEDIFDNLEDLTNYAIKKGHMIVGSVDTHAFDSWEFKGAKTTGPNGEKPNFPRHCIKGTNGWLKILETFVANSIFVPNQHLHYGALLEICQKPDLKAIYLEKEVYSLFANPNATFFLERLIDGKTDSEFVVYGVATDYCVKAACEGLSKSFPNIKIKLVTDAIKGVSPETTKAALNLIINTIPGIQFVATKTVISE